ncbi:metallophosphoesterase [bacterium]|nr:metallophosphoesterase [bacterium]
MRSTKHVGEPDYSFDVRGVHFVMLDTGRYEAPNEVRDDQIDWLKKDLSEHKDAIFTIVISHKPYWINTVAKGKPDKLHDIFVANSVDAVFTGHFHNYFAGEFDGIKYTSVGSSGGGAEEDPTGLLYHFVWATFDGENLSLAPIKKDAVLPWDQMTAKEYLFIKTINSRGITTTKAPIRNDLRVAKTKISVKIDNLCAESPIEDVLKWNVPKGWQVKPEGMQIKVAPGESLDAEFTVRCKGPLYPVPSFTLNCPYRKDGTMKVEKELGMFRTAVARKAGTPPVIDGKLTENVWRKPTTTFFKPDYVEKEVEPSEFYFAYDSDNLYLAAKCFDSKMDKLTAELKNRDEMIFGEDCVGYFLQTVEDGPVYQIYFTPLGTAFDQKIVMEEDGSWDADRGWNGEYIVKTARGADYWNIEVSIPLEQLGAKGTEGKAFAVNFRRKQPRLKSAADWQVPISYDPETFGVLELK